MKIDNSVKSATSLFSGPARPANGTVPQNAVVAGEKVALSPLSARLQEIASSLDTPEVNSSRVAEIRQAIAEGRFKVNPERIADGLLDDVRQLLATRR